MSKRLIAARSFGYVLIVVGFGSMAVMVHLGHYDKLIHGGLVFMAVGLVGIVLAFLRPTRHQPQHIVDWMSVLEFLCAEPGMEAITEIITLAKHHHTPAPDPDHIMMVIDGRHQFTCIICGQNYEGPRHDRLVSA